MAQVVSLGVSVGPAGVWAALCSGAHFFTARVAGACLALDSSSGCDLVLALYSFGRSFTGHKKVGDLERDQWYVSFDRTAQVLKLRRAPLGNTFGVFLVGRSPLTRLWKRCIGISGSGKASWALPEQSLY